MAGLPPVAVHTASFWKLMTTASRARSYYYERQRTAAKVRMKQQQSGRTRAKQPKTGGPKQRASQATKQREPGSRQPAATWSAWLAGIVVLAPAASFFAAPKSLSKSTSVKLADGDDYNSTSSKFSNYQLQWFNLNPTTSTNCTAIYLPQQFLRQYKLIIPPERYKNKFSQQRVLWISMEELVRLH
jgi:hypothetical protein